MVSWAGGAVAWSAPRKHVQHRVRAAQHSPCGQAQVRPPQPRLAQALPARARGPAAHPVPQGGERPPLHHQRRGCEAALLLHQGPCLRFRALPPVGGRTRGGAHSALLQNAADVLVPRVCGPVSGLLLPSRFPVRNSPPRMRLAPLPHTSFPSALTAMAGRVGPHPTTPIPASPLSAGTQRGHSCELQGRGRAVSRVTHTPGPLTCRALAVPAAFVCLAMCNRVARVRLSYGAPGVQLGGSIFSWGGGGGVEVVKRVGAGLVEGRRSRAPAASIGSYGG